MLRLNEGQDDTFHFVDSPQHSLLPWQLMWHLVFLTWSQRIMFMSKGEREKEGEREGEGR